MISLNPEHYKVRIRRSKRLRYRMLRALLPTRAPIPSRSEPTKTTKQTRP